MIDNMKDFFTIHGQSIVPDVTNPVVQTQTEPTPEPEIPTSLAGLTNAEIIELSDTNNLTQAFDLFLSLIHI